MVRLLKNNFIYFRLCWVLLSLWWVGFSSWGLSWLQSRSWIRGMQVSAAAPGGPRSCGSQSGEHGLNSCGARTSLLCSMWNLPEPGIKPTSPALAGGFYTTEPLGKPSGDFFKGTVLSQILLKQLLKLRAYCCFLKAQRQKTARNSENVRRRQMSRPVIITGMHFSALKCIRIGS